MISLRKRSKLPFYLLSALLTLTLLWSCKSKPDPREQLVRSLKGANVDGFFFGAREDDTQAVTSLRNNALLQPVKLDSGSLILSYASVLDKKDNTTTVYKSEVTKTGANLTYLLSDLASGQSIVKQDFPPIKRPNPPDPACPKVFDTLDDCIADINCALKPAAVCEANRTCKPQRYGGLCCLKNGSIIAVDAIAFPTRRLCLTHFPLDDEQVALAQ